jgi:hypothetical protein
MDEPHVPMPVAVTPMAGALQDFLHAQSRCVGPNPSALNATYLRDAELELPPTVGPSQARTLASGWQKPAPKSSERH